jgi:hypothetical protein
VLSGRGLCDKLTTRPEESYRLWCVVVCDIETSSMRSQKKRSRWSGPHHASLQVRHPASTLAYRVRCILIADLIIIIIIIIVIIITCPISQRMWVNVTQVNHQFLSALALSLVKAPICLYPSVCPHVSDLILETSMKIFRRNPNLVKVGQK